MFLEERESHYEKFLGAMNESVMHSTDVKPVHIDIYTFIPTRDRKFFTLITGGMSDCRQAIPAGSSISPRAEIMLYAHEPKGWMYNVLKGLAEMPTDNDTFLSYCHTVANGMPMTAEPSLLTSFFFVWPFLEPDGFSPMVVDGDAADILLMIPITEGERHLAREKGGNALIDLFQDSNFDPVINERRSCLVTDERPPR